MLDLQLYKFTHACVQDCGTDVRAQAWEAWGVDCLLYTSDAADE